MSNTRDAEVLQLGKSLAEALDNSDITGRWMAHHLADLITQCQASPEDSDLATLTRETILQFWAHKSGAPFRRRPFENLDPVFAALERLEPDPPPWAFYGTFSKSSSPAPAALTSYPLLPAAINLERIVATVIGLSVAVVSRDAIGLEEEWVVAATAMAETERDRATMLLQQAERRQRLRPQGDPRELLTIDPTFPDEPFDPNDDGTESAGAETDAPKPDPLDPALLAAISSCRVALDRLEGCLVTAED